MLYCYPENIKLESGLFNCQTQPSDKCSQRLTSLSETWEEYLPLQVVQRKKYVKKKLCSYKRYWATTNSFLPSLGSKKLHASKLSCQDERVELRVVSLRVKLWPLWKIMSWRVEIISDRKCQSSHVGDGDVSAQCKKYQGSTPLLRMECWNIENTGTSEVNFDICKKE